MINKREQQILNFVSQAGYCSSKDIFENVKILVSYATLKRILTNLKSENYLTTKRTGK